MSKRIAVAFVHRTVFELTNNGAPRFFFNDTSAGGIDWQFSKLSNHNLTISDQIDGGLTVSFVWETRASSISPWIR